MFERLLLAVGFVAANASVSLAAQTSKADLAFGLGFVVNAQGQCDALLVNAETLSNAIEGLGSDPRNSSSPFNAQFVEGMEAALSDANICGTAWAAYGCDGSKISRLVMENPFENSSATKCVLPALRWND